MVKGCVPKPGLLHGHTLCRWEVGEGQDRWGLGSEAKEIGGGQLQGAEETVRFPGSWSCFPSLKSSTVSGPMKERLKDVSGVEVHSYKLSTLVFTGRGSAESSRASFTLAPALAGCGLFSGLLSGGLLKATPKTQR